VKDEMRLCQCGEQHPWGIVRLSEDHVPLYGARDIETCDNFRTMPDAVPAFVDNLQELWAQTPDLDPQVPLATRGVIARIRSLADPRAQWSEFVGLVVSQITNMRGAMVRDESKFAHLVAHTDEIVNAMRDVVGLKEQLHNMRAAIVEVVGMMEDLRVERDTKYAGEVEAFEHFGLIDRADWKPRKVAFLREYARSQVDEPILTEKGDDV